MTPEEQEVPLSRHADIVRSIYKDFEWMEQSYRIITGRQDPDGHRYSGERCVWCNVNYLDRLMYDPKDSVCEGERRWNDEWWPLEKMDALLKEHRDGIRAEREARIEAQIAESAEQMQKDLANDQ